MDGVLRASPYAKCLDLRAPALREAEVAKRLDDVEVSEFSRLLDQAAKLTR